MAMRKRNLSTFGGRILKFRVKTFFILRAMQRRTFLTGDVRGGALMHDILNVTVVWDLPTVFDRGTRVFAMLAEATASWSSSFPSFCPLLPKWTQPLARCGTIVLL